MHKITAVLIACMILVMPVFSSAAPLEEDAVMTDSIDSEPSVYAHAMGGSMYQIVITDAEDASSVGVPTWTTVNGQDDTVWYVAHRNADGLWTVEIDTALHGGGEMISHVYVDQRWAGAVTFTAPVPEGPGVLAIPKNGSDYRIQIANLPGASSVQVPTWNAAYGQEDIVWYDAQAEGNGIFSVDIDTARHRGGEIICHVYADGKPVGGVTFFSPSVPVTVEMQPLGGVRYSVTIKNLYGVSEVEVPTWGLTNGQDDIIWYAADKVADGTWCARINAVNHDNGTIESHVYADGKGLCSDLHVSRQGLSLQVPGYEATSSNEANLSRRSVTWGPGGAKDSSGRPVGPSRLQTQYAGYGANFIGPAGKEIYLTFDEGYEAGYTGKILDTLKQKGVKAAFFVTDAYVKSNPELVQRMIDEGHQVGNHTVNHKNMPSLSSQQVISEIMQLHTKVQKQFGYDMRLFRFPEGAFSERDLAITRALGYDSTFWSFGYNDWDQKRQPGYTEALRKTTGSLHPGAIYLLHAVSRTNAAILGDFIDSAAARGILSRS